MGGASSASRDTHAWRDQRKTSSLSVAGKTVSSDVAWFVVMRAPAKLIRPK